MSNNNSYTTVSALLSSGGISFFNSVPDIIEKLREKLGQEYSLSLFLQRHGLEADLYDILNELESKAQEGSNKTVLTRLSALWKIIGEVCSRTGSPGRPEELAAKLRAQLESIKDEIKPIPKLSQGMSYAP